MQKPSNFEVDGFCYVTCIKLFKNNDRVRSEAETIFV